jgi:methionine synthase II (cobalamin-independent)
LVHPAAGAHRRRSRPSSRRRGSGSVTSQHNADRTQDGQVAQRIERALEFVSPERLVLGPDCGIKYLSRELAFAKLTALASGAEIVRSRLS